ncbi:MAG: hypothetical protein NTW38_11185 [Candidatus Aminicenantes bacterium]|nr:hypothetical protein [Candidatus Aminicenantes bacterium]
MTEKHYPLRLRGKVLEDLFFFKQDLVLAGEKRQIRKTEYNLKTLSEISGITDEAILRKLTELKIQVEVLATLSIIPLVEVAWANGKIDDKEREAILKAAESFGVFKGHVNRSLFEHWLQNHPPKGMIESWIFYMQGLCQLLSKNERRALKTDLLQRARKVAEAESGKAKAKSKISRRKEEVLLLLEQAFEPLHFKV